MEDHFAWTISFPLLHPSFVLDPPSTEQEWNRLHDDWLQQVSNAGIIDCEQARDWFWADYSLPMAQAEAIRVIAERLLECRGGAVVLKPSEEGVLAPNSVGFGPVIDESTAWYRISRLVPSDVLCAAAWTGAYKDCPRETETLSPDLARMLSEGISDCHIHLGAAFFYSEFLQLITTPGKALTSLAKMADVANPEAVFEMGWIKSSFGYECFPPALAIIGGLLGGAITLSLVEDGNLDGIGSALVRNSEALLGLCLSKEAAHGSFSDWVAQSSSVLRSLDAQYPTQVRNADHVAFGPADEPFLCEILEQDKTELQPSPWRKCLDGFLTLRSLLHHSLTALPTRDEFLSFRKWFRTMAATRSLLLRHQDVSQTVKQLVGPRARLLGVDFRTGMGPRQAYDFCREWDTQRRKGTCDSQTKLAFSCGLAKPDRSDTTGGSISPRLSWGVSMQRLLSCASEMLQVLSDQDRVTQREPGRTAFVAGLDIYNDEASPNWPYILLFQHLKSRLAQERLSHLRVSHTYHAGEISRSSVEGIRKIHEVVVGCDFREPCRIGHGTALLRDVSRHGGSSRGVPLGVRLEDSIWAQHMWKRHSTSLYNAARQHTYATIQSIRQQLELNGARKKASLFQESNAAEIAQAFASLQSLADVERLGLASSQDGKPWFTPESIDALEGGSTVSQVLHAILTSGTLRDVLRRNSPLPSPPMPAQSLLGLREIVVEALANRNVVIECCIASNVTISDLGSYESHPVFELTSATPGASPALGVCLGSDDPIIFDTTVDAEYHRLYLASKRKLGGALSASRWVVDLARQSNVACFALQSGQR